jgi:hypothetical protein
MVAFLASEAAPTLGRRTIYLTWADPGDGTASFAAMGRGTLVCDQADACRIDNFSASGASSRRSAAPGTIRTRSPSRPTASTCSSRRASACRAIPAQQLDTNLGKVLRLNLDGTPAEGNPFAARGGVSREIWSYGHRNLLGSSSTSTASCGTSSTARAAATRSTRSSRATTTAGRCARTATTMTAT